MKENVEKKLGCSIEEYCEERDAMHAKYEGMEIAVPPDERILKLTKDEVEFLVKCIKDREKHVA